MPIHDFGAAAAAAAHPHSEFENAVCFSVTADADPGMVSKVLGPVTKRGLSVDRLNAVLEKGEDPVMLIDYQVSGLGPDGTGIVAAVLEQTVGVRTVLVCRKEDSRAA